ncbi:MAG: hypothetical protein WC389_15095 [Lutibacter sp.]|jgi:hypothetical protein
MFEELEKYKTKGHFFFSEKEELKSVCNARINGIGVYLVYALKGGKIELIYIGSSGKILQNGQKKIRIGGIADRIINGKQFGEPRKKSWKAKIIAENIEVLDIYWYETFDKKSNDIPSTIEGILIQRFYDIYGVLPKWNKEF